MKEKIAITRGWWEAEDVLVVRFEDLVGLLGGGSRDAQVTAIQSIAQHIGLPVDARTAAQIGVDAFGKGSTFRLGGIGSWRDHFDRRCQQVFDEAIGGISRELGYP